ncbi:hypothetical protein BU26DRAFT_171946 [Trematosphaeria pertusa]|uniref:Uncharacterized protein n=1 Tax=Trematosphaeria pertusa TaxID=390896 RepID=A0A6A6HV36_9PLEO|nr:uncharacterized protein BU26DRAFT_171946 [Trematosphaeria pertusa]KAF2241881.1 hypothetical protein BU26DRAFT_171946 [Trematosphaeria pertusa]
MAPERTRNGRTVASELVAEDVVQALYASPQLRRICKVVVIIVCPNFRSKNSTLKLTQRFWYRLARIWIRAERCLLASWLAFPFSDTAMVAPFIAYDASVDKDRAFNLDSRITGDRVPLLLLLSCSEHRTVSGYGQSRITYRGERKLKRKVRTCTDRRRTCPPLLEYSKLLCLPPTLVPCPCLRLFFTQYMNDA